MKYTDPSGDYVHLIIGAAIGGVVNWAMHGAQFNAQGLGYFAIGAVTGALAAGIGAGVGAALAGTTAAGGGFAAGFWGSSTLSSTGFIAGAAAGSAAGFAGGFTSGFSNAMLGQQGFHTAWHSALKEGGIAGLSGGIIGGVAGGIQSALKGGGFFESGTISTIRVEHEIAKIQQDGMWDCLPACGESISGIPQSDIRGWFGDNGAIENNVFGSKFGEVRGRMFGIRGPGSFTQSSVFSDFKSGADVIFSSGVENGISNHANVLRSATRQVVDFTRSATRTSFRFVVMDPARGGFFRFDPMNSILMIWQ